MANKFGKFLLFTAAVGTAAAAAYYYTHKKESDMAMFMDDDDDYDDFSDDLDDDAEPSRNYVPLNMEPQETAEKDTESPFTPLAEQISQESDNDMEETIEEFFDEEDSTDEEPPISDN